MKHVIIPQEAIFCTSLIWHKNK